MNTKQHVFTLAMAVIAGLLGGIISSQLFMGQPVFAQKTPTHEKVVVAEEFRLVDAEQRTRASLMVTRDSKTVALLLVNKKGKAQVGLLIRPEGPSLELEDDNGKTRAVLGSTPSKLIPAGETGKRSPASLVLFDKQGKIVWSAP